MKRPGGFDRTPDAPRPESGTEFDERRHGPGAAPASVPATVPATGESPTGPPRPRLSRVRGPQPERTPATAPDSAGTIDLSDVRAARTAALRPGATLGDEHATVDLGALDAPRRPMLERFRGTGQDPVRVAERRLAAAARQRRRQARGERRRFSAEARRRRRRWYVVLAAVGALVLFVAAGVFTPLMAVREIEVSGVESVDAGKVQEALERFEGRPLALIDDGEVHRALEPFPVIQRYAVERVPPHTLVVRIEERTPVISVAGSEGVQLYDAAGVLLGSADAAPAGVPLGEGALTDLSSAAFRSASRALRDMPADLRGQITGASATSAQDVTFALASGITVIWGDADDSRRKAVVLQAMLSSLADQSVSRIDVSATEAPVFE